MLRIILNMLNALLIPLFLQYLPIQDTNAKMHIGMILNELLSGSYLRKLMSYAKICSRKQIIIPDRTKDKEFNPLFDKIQDYLTVKYSKQIESCELVPKNGDVEFSLTDLSGKKFTDTCELLDGTTHTFEMCIETAGDGYSSSYDSGGNSSTTHSRQIVIKSKTANPDAIKAYVKKISSVQNKGSNMIKIYRPIVQGKKKDEKTIEWEHIIVKTNKTLFNTIYSKEIEKDLFQDIERFMLAEDWYSQRGIPYKRGYFLHSKPGQGKTSVAKIIANKYGCPVFCLDITVIEDNANLTKLMTDINYFTSNSRYILLIEDADRTEFLNPSFSRREPLISMDCFLNAIDGVAEPHGRIILMSANEPECILKNSALIRPGRIDKIIEIKACNIDQIQRMYNLFYEGHPYVVNWDHWKLNEELSAAYIIKLLQENVDKPELFMHLIGEAKAGDDAVLTSLDDTFQKTVAAAKAEQKVETAEDGMFRGSRSKKRSRRKAISQKIEDKVRRTKTHLERSKQKLKVASNALKKAEAKLPKLLEKLNKKKEAETKRKLREKAIRRAEYNKKLRESKRVNAEITGNKDEPDDGNENPSVDDNSDVTEEEYETPAFLMNSIDADKVPAGTLVTYEHMEDGEESTPINLFELNDIAKDIHKSKPIRKRKHITAPPRLDNVESTSTLRRRKNAKIKVPITPDDDNDEESDKETTANHATCGW